MFWRICQEKVCQLYKKWSKLISNREKQKVNVSIIRVYLFCFNFKKKYYQRVSEVMSTQTK